MKTAENYFGATNEINAFERQPPVIGFCAFNGTGKTTLLKKIIPLLRERNLRLAVIKDDQHDVEIDHPEPTLAQLIDDLDYSNLDLILIEGFKNEPYTKIELRRAATSKPWLYKRDKNIVAVAADQTHSAHLPVLDISQPGQIVEFMLEYVGIDPKGT